MIRDFLFGFFATYGFVSFSTQASDVFSRKPFVFHDAGSVWVLCLCRLSSTVS